MSPSFRRSRKLIVQRVRRTLIDADPRASLIPEYAALLMEAGLEDANVLFAVAVHHAFLDDTQAALAVLDKLIGRVPEGVVLITLASDRAEA